jgi:phosphoglycolate phosphatase
LPLCDTLLFDLDGTLTDPRVGILESMRYALGKMGRRSLPPDEEISWCIGPPIRANFARLLQTDDSDRIEQALAFYRERFGTVGKFENEVYEGIPEALEAILAAGYTLLVATSKPTIYSVQILERFGLACYFTAVYGSEMDGVRGAKPELIAHLLERESLSPAKCLMIGDREHDMLGAAACGMVGWGVTWGYGSAEELREAGAERLFDTPAALAATLVA